MYPDLIDRMSAVIMQARLDAAAEATPTACANCDEPTRSSELRAVYGYDEPWCVSCIADGAERQQEARDEAYYGGDL